jgi:1,4-dihydroxy-2-naphthoate octaprenyltransferase
MVFSSIILTVEKKGKLTLGNPWLLAIRPKTLSAAVAPVIVGSTMAYADSHLMLLPAFACMLSAILLQIGSNLANDVFDYEKGADKGERLGPTRVTQAGLLTSNQVKLGMCFAFGVAALLGVYLIIVGGWPILILGLAAILSAVAYTGGPYPLGYHGLGDLFVFIFFGLSATAGTYYLQVGIVSSPVWWMAVAMGFLTINILVINNMRDIENDRRVNKMTLAVKLGMTGARIEFYGLITFAYLIPLGIWITDLATPWVMLTWLSIPLAIKWVRFITINSGKALNNALEGAGRIELMYSFLFAIGIIISVYM